MIQKPAHTGNYSRGRPGGKVTGIVIHVMDGTLKGTDSWFANPKADASAHYGIGHDGEIHQYVDESDTAWHASKWSANINTIGLEHEGYQKKGEPLWQPSESQYSASVGLASEICLRYDIEPSLETIFTHSRFNKYKPDCPGEGFPLEQYIKDVAARVTEAKGRDKDYLPVRLFDKDTNQQVGLGTLIRGTDKVYIKSMQH